MADFDDHERFIAKIYQGKRVKGSGSTITQKGDVRVASQAEIFECKMSGTPGKPRRTKLTKDMEKVAQEAYEEGKDPVVALRYFDPDSTLAQDGYVDFVVRLARDDARRSDRLAED